MVGGLSRANCDRGKVSSLMMKSLFPRNPRSHFERSVLSLKFNGLSKAKGHFPENSTTTEPAASSAFI